MSAGTQRKRQTAAKGQTKTSGDSWDKIDKKSWNDRCLQAFLAVRPLAKDMDPDVHCRVLLIIANAVKGSGISAGHVGRLAGRLFDQIAEMLVKARKYDELTKPTKAETDAE